MSRPWCPPPSRQASCSWSPPPVWWPWAWRPRQPWAKPDLPGEGKVQVPGRISVGLCVRSCVRPVSLSGVIVRPTSLSNCTCVAPEYCKQDDLVNQVLSYVTHLVTTKNIQREKVWSTPDMVAQAIMCAASSHSQTGILKFSLVIQLCRWRGGDVIKVHIDCACNLHAFSAAPSLVRHQVPRAVQQPHSVASPGFQGGHKIRAEKIPKIANHQ